MQIAKEKAEELAPEIKDSETSKQKIKKNRNKQPQKKNQPKAAEKPVQPQKKEKKEKLHVLIPDEITVGRSCAEAQGRATEIIKPAHASSV